MSMVKMSKVSRINFNPTRVAIIHKEKVLDIRRQLTTGKYNLSKRLDAVLDKILEDITT